jgi:lysophospholipase L1-like esterase
MSPNLLSRTFILTALLVAFAPGTAMAGVTKVACLGASTTSGAGSTAGHHFPDELGVALGPAYQVKNFGVSGTTVLKSGDSPYWKFPQLQQAIAFQPDIAVFWFGGNDAKPGNWTGHMAEFIADYEEMVRMVQAVPSHPKTYLFLSMVIHDVEGIPKLVLEQQVLPEVKRVAAETGSFVIDYHDAFITHPEYFPDAVHPNDAGTAAIGKFVADILLMPQPPSDGGTAGVSLDGSSATGGDGSTMPPAMGGDAATAANVDASPVQTPPSSNGSGPMGSGSTGASSGAGSGSTMGSTAGMSSSSGGATSNPGTSPGDGYGTGNGGSGCAASGSRPLRSDAAASIGLALLGLLAIRRKTN